MFERKKHTNKRNTWNITLKIALRNVRAQVVFAPVS